MNIVDYQPKKQNVVIRHQTREKNTTETHTDRPDSLLWVSEGLSESGEVGVEVDGRRDDLQQTRLDLCRKTDTRRRRWFASSFTLFVIVYYNTRHANKDKLRQTDRQSHVDGGGM